MASVGGKQMKLFRRIRYNAPFTITFVLISFIALLVNGRTNGAANRLLFSVYRSDLRDPLTYIRAFTHVLGHSSFTHYSGNIMLMLVLGPTLEERYGSATIFYLSALTALIAGIAHCLLYSNVMLLGASSLVFMMILLSSVGGARDGSIPLTLILAAILYIGGETVTGMISRDDISQLSHIIGGVCGAAFGMVRKGRRR
jgi:rhomboid protease GluP